MYRRLARPAHSCLLFLALACSSEQAPSTDVGPEASTSGGATSSQGNTTTGTAGSSTTANNSTSSGAGTSSGSTTSTTSSASTSSSLASTTSSNSGVSTSGSSANTSFNDTSSTGTSSNGTASDESVGTSDVSGGETSDEITTSADETSGNESSRGEASSTNNTGGGDCTPDPGGDFVTEGDVVFDEKTCLRWMKADVNGHPYAAGDAYCESLELGGYDDWRLPTAGEATTLFHCEGTFPPVYAVFTVNYDGIWTTTETGTIAGDEPKVCGAGQSSGQFYDFGKVGAQNTRCVRGPITVADREDCKTYNQVCQ